MSRSRLLPRWLALAASVTFALCTLAPAHAGDETGYRFSPVNQYGINVTAAYWNPIIAWVSEKSGVPLQFNRKVAAAGVNSQLAEGYARREDKAYRTL